MSPLARKDDEDGGLAEYVVQPRDLHAEVSERERVCLYIHTIIYIVDRWVDR